jgi:hypothetical protein
MILVRSAGANILICSGVIERTLTNIAYELRVTSLFSNMIGRIIVPFDLRASSVNAEATPLEPVLEFAVPQEAAVAEEGILGFVGFGARMDRDVGEGILGIVAAA